MSIWRRILQTLKLLIAGLLVLYCIVLLVQNSQQATVWYWPNKQQTMSVAYLALFAFFAGALVMFLAGATLWTLVGRRWKKRAKEHEEKARYLTEAHRKAAMLRQKPAFAPHSNAPLVEPGSVASAESPASKP
jgi:uncharacterized integral membrane protein